MKLGLNIIPIFIHILIYSENALSLNIGELEYPKDTVVILKLCQESRNYLLTSELQDSTFNLLSEINVWCSTHGYLTPVPLIDLNISGYYLSTGQIDKSSTHGLKSLNEYRNRKDTSGMIAALNNLGLIMHKLHDGSQALKYYLEALDYVQNDTRKTAGLNINIADVYQNIEKPDLAYQHTNEGLNLAIQIGDSFLISTSLILKGIIEYKHLNYPLKGKRSLRSALKISQLIHNPRSILASKINLGACYTIIGQLDSSIYYLNSASSMIPNVKDDIYKIALYHAYSEYYRTSGDVDKSLYYIRLKDKLKDRIDKGNASKIVKEDLIQRMNSSEKNSFDLKSLIAIFLIVLSISVGIYFKVLQNKNRKLLSENKRQITLVSNNSKLTVHIDDVLRLNSDNNYTKFYFKNRQPILIAKTLKDYEKVLPNSTFIRVHQSHIINIKCLESIETKKGNITLILNDKSEIPVSNKYRDRVTEVFHFEESILA